MRWHDLARLYTPVTATPLQRSRPGQSRATLESGGRWGKPSAFSWSNEAAKQSPDKQSVTDRTPSGSPAEYMRIVNAQLLVASEKVRVRSPTDESVWIEIDRMRRMVFHYTEVLPRSSPSGMTPTRTTYFDLSFDLHPSPAEECMRLAPAFRRRFVVPVQSQPTERRAPHPVVDVAPEAGARWGRPASFDQASRPRPSTEPAGFTASWIDTWRVFKGFETHREVSRVPAGETEPEGIRSVTFYCGTRKERRDVGGVIFTSLIHDYVKLDFPLFEPRGARGKPHPPPTPEDEV